MKIRNKMKYSNKAINNNNLTQKITSKMPFYIGKDKNVKDSHINKNNNINNIKKSTSFYISKRIQELKNNQNLINFKKEHKIENTKKHKNKLNKNCAYTFQNIISYPRPEPLPKKIDIRIVNHNNNFNSSNINETSIITHKNRYDKNIYDDKKILFILTNLGLENLYSKFKDNFITYNDLIFLTKDDFIEMEIPIGPRNRIINFIHELKRYGINLKFDELKNFIEKYKGTISGKNRTINDRSENLLDFHKLIKKSQNISSAISSPYESEKNENVSFMYKPKSNDYKNNISFVSNNNYKKSNINNLKRYYSYNNVTHKILNNDNKKKKLYSENNIKKIDSSEKKKVNDLRQIINDINCKIKSNSYIFDNKKNLNFFNRPNSTKNIGDIKKNNYIYNNNITYNYGFLKSPSLNNNYSNYSNFSKYNEFVPKSKNNRSNNIKNIINKEQFLSLSRNSKNDSFHSFNNVLSKNLINKLEIINKEVEKYENNYERLKNETKIIKKKVFNILSSNGYFFKKQASMKMNDISSGYFNNIVPLDIIGLQKEKERNIKKEIIDSP